MKEGKEMRITRIKYYSEIPSSLSLPELVDLIYSNLKGHVGESIKFIRRYRHNIVGIEQKNEKCSVYHILFSFNHQEVLYKFREELQKIEKAPK